MAEFVKQQPVDGETVMHCGHLENTPHHFFGFGEDLPTIRFQRPDKTWGDSRWMVLCNSCFPKNFEHPHTAMRADATWIGDAPAIKENLQ